MVWATYWFLILYGPLPLRAGLCLIVSFSSFSLPFCSFLQFCYHFLSFHSAIPAVILFDPNLLGLFGPAAYSFCNDSIWSFGLCFKLLVGSLSHLFPPRHPWPICFPWASLALFLTLRSHGLLLTLLGFLDLVTLSFILEAHGLAINPLLSLLVLLWVYCGSFSLFYITYCPWVCYFSLSKLL